MRLKTKNFKRLYQWHRRLGLFLLIHLLILIGTGSVLIFRHELEGITRKQSSAPNKEAASASVSSPLPYQAIIDQITQQYPNDRLLSFFVDENDPNYLQVRLGINGSKKFRGARKIQLDRYGKIITTTHQAEANTLLEQLLILHREFFLGSFGKIYVGFIGLLFLLSLISGLIIYGPLMKKLYFGLLRGGWKSLYRWSDLHKFLGVATFAWCFLIAISGVFLAFSSQLLKIYQYTELKKIETKYHGTTANDQTVSLDAALQEALLQTEKLDFAFVAFPDNEFTTANHYLFFMKGKTPLTEKLRTLVLVDAASGQVVEVRKLPWYLKAVLLSEPLHFGDYGGWPLKIIWLIFALISLSLPISGFILYLQRNEWLPSEKHFNLMPLIRKTPLGLARRKPYLLPALFALVILLGMVVALVLDSPWDILAWVLLALPLGISLFLTIQDSRSIGSEK